MMHLSSLGRTGFYVVKYVSNKVKKPFDLRERLFFEKRGKLIL